MGIFKSFKIKNRIKENDPKAFSSKDQLPWNIYEPGVQLGKHLKKFHLFHFIIKYKIIVPMCLLFDKIYENRLKINISDEWYDKNIKIFDEEWEKTIIDWNYKFRVYVPRNEKRKRNIKNIKRLIDTNLSNIILRSIKKLILVGYLLDTAYREFGNILMFNLSKRMQDEYAGKKNYHLFYTGKNSMDVEYLVVGDIIEKYPTYVYRVDKRGKYPTNIKLNKK